MYGILNALGDFIGNIIGHFFGYNLLANMALNLVSWQDNTNDALYTFVTGVYEVIVPFALALSFGFAILEILSTLTRQGPENVTISAIVFPLIKMTVIWYLIYNGLTIVGYLMGGSDWFVDKIRELGEDAMAISTPETGVGAIDVAGFIAKLLINMVISVLSTLFCAIAGILLGLQIISVKIEFLIRTMFMPLALCTISNGGSHSAGMRYFKKMIGSMFILGGVIASIFLVKLIGEGIMTSFFNALSGDGDFIGNVETALSDGIPNYFAGAFFSAFIGPFTCVSCVSIVKAAINDAFS